MAAQNGYQSCVNRILTDDNPEVASLRAELRVANEIIATAPSRLGDMEALLKEIAKALSIGARLIAVLPPTDSAR